MGRTAIVAGASGLVGGRLTEKLLAHEAYDRVKVLVRKPLDIEHVKLEQIQVNWDRLESYSASLTGNDIFCCLGSTTKKAGDRVTYRKIDLEYPLALARITRANGATHFSLVSSMGADTKSMIFYSRLKGETEEAIAAVGFHSYHIVRPSMLLGDRKEDRTGESAAKVLMKFFNAIIPKHMRAIDAGRVASAMIHYALESRAGRHAHRSGELQRFV
jgi:uncharacterized protein YbjT (DUF2867 family)